MMKRREFGQKLGGAAIAAALAGPAAASAAQALRKNTLMHVGGDYHAFFQREGVLTITW